MSLKLIYLATPYSHPCPTIRAARFRVVTAVAAKMMREGEIVFSPITHCHPMAEAGGLPTEWAFWQVYDELMITKCQLMVVVMQVGWKESVGVQREIAIAEENDIPVEYYRVN